MQYYYDLFPPFLVVFVVTAAWKLFQIYHPAVGQLCGSHHEENILCRHNNRNTRGEFQTYNRLKGTYREKLAFSVLKHIHLGLLSAYLQ